jgi:hypothetical protein
MKHIKKYNDFLVEDLNNVYDEFDSLLEFNSNNFVLLKAKLINLFNKLKDKKSILSFLNKYIPKFYKFNSNIGKKLILILLFLASSKISSSEIKNHLQLEKYVAQYVNKLFDMGIMDIGENSIFFNTMDLLEDETVDFLEKLSYRESRNNWKISKKGYIGQYQLGKYAFKDIGKDEIKHDDFQKNPNIYPEIEQNQDVIKLLKKNKTYLKNYYKYIGQTINGIEITESGILAAAHLVGQKSIKNFLDSNGKKDRKDGNGTRCSDYLKYFSGYTLNLLK